MKENVSVLHWSGVSFHYIKLSLQCESDNKDRTKKLERQKTESGKKNRIQQKINRMKEQTPRWLLSSYYNKNDSQASK